MVDSPVLACLAVISCLAYWQAGRAAAPSVGKLVRWSSVGWLAKSEPRLHAQISISLDRSLLNICIRRSTPVLGFSRFETGRACCACHPECNNHWEISSSVLTRILALQYTRGGRFCIASLMTPRHEFHFHIITRHPNSHSRPRTHHSGTSTNSGKDAPCHPHSFCGKNSYQVKG